MCLFIILLPRLSKNPGIPFSLTSSFFHRSSTPVRERHQQLQQLPNCNTSSPCPACARPKLKPTSAWPPHRPPPLPPSSPHRAPSTRPAARATSPASPPSAGRITTTTTARGSRPGTPPRRPHREIAAVCRRFCRASLRSPASTPTPQLQLLRHSCRQQRPATARAVLATCAAARRSSALLTIPAAGSTRKTTTRMPRWCSYDDSLRTPRTTWTRWTAR